MPTPELSLLRESMGDKALCKLIILPKVKGIDRHLQKLEGAHFTELYFIFSIYKVSTSKDFLKPRGFLN